MLSRALVLVLALLSAPHPGAASTYPMEGGNLRRVGSALSPTAFAMPLDLQWAVFSCATEACSNPVVLEDRLILPTLYGITCLRRGDGAWLWSRGFYRMYNTPAYDADRDLLYACNQQGYLAALRPSDGSVVWSRNPSGDIYSYAAVTYLGGRILIQESATDWACLDADTQAVLWRHSFSKAFNGGTPALDGGFLYVGGSNGELACLNWSDGTPVWVKQNGWMSAYTGAITLSDTRLFAMTQAGKVECRERSDGSLVWSFQAASYGNGNLSYDGTRLYCSNDDRHIRALDPDTGAVIWDRNHVGNFARSAPHSCGGYVFSSGCSGSFYGDNAGTGSPDWEAVHGTGDSFNDFASADGELFVSNFGGQVYCFRSHCPGCTATVTVSPTATRTASPTLTFSVTKTLTATRTETPTATPSASPSETPTASPTASPSGTPSQTPTASSSATPSATPSQTPTATPSGTLTASPSVTRTATPSGTPTASPTDSPTATQSATLTATPSQTPYQSPTLTVVPPTATPEPNDAPGGLDDPGSGCYAYPNPSEGGDVHIVYRVDGPCKARIRVFQAAGDPAASVEERHESGGVKRCTVPAGGFAPGVYFYKVDMRYDDGRHDKRPLGKFICRPH